MPTYHLTINGKPICRHDKTLKCEFSTRREAFDQQIQLEKIYNTTVEVKLGYCPAKFELRGPAEGPSANHP